MLASALLALLLVPAGAGAVERPRQTYPFDGILGWRLDVPLDYGLVRAFRGRLRGTELLLLSPKSAERWTRAGRTPPADGGVLRVETVSKDDPEFGGVKADLTFMREAMRRARTERGDSFTIEDCSMSLPAFIVRTSAPEKKVEVVAEGRRLLYKFAAGEDGPHLRELLAGLREAASAPPRARASARPAEPPQRARAASPSEDRRALEAAAHLRSEPVVGWKLAAVAHLARGARHAGLYLPLFAPGGALVQEGGVEGTTFERAPDGTLTMLEDSWGLASPPRPLLEEKLGGSDYRRLGRREGLPLERLGPGLLGGIRRLRALYRAGRRDEALEAVGEYAALFSADGSAFVDWLPRSVRAAAEESLRLEFLRTERDEKGARLLFRQHDGDRKSVFALRAAPVAPKSSRWSVVSAE